MRPKRSLAAFCLLLSILTQAGGQEKSSDESTKGRAVVALVLEGGGALGLAHIPIIKEIEDLHIPIDIVTGTSMGAIIGGLYAIGYDADDLQRILSTTDWQDLFMEQIPARTERYRKKQDRYRYVASVGVDRKGIKTSAGLISGTRILTFLEGLTASIPTPTSFDDLPRRFRAVATDVASGEAVVMDRGSLAEAMRSSMSIPGLFVPYKLEGRSLIDGGVVNNLPIDIARAMGADIIIAVDLWGGFSMTDRYDRGPLEALSRTVDIMVRENVKRQLEGADLVITADLRKYTVLDFLQTDAILAVGEEAAKNNRDKLSALAARIGAAEASPASPSIQGLTLSVEGGSERDRKVAESILSPALATGGGGPENLAERALQLYDQRPLSELRLNRGEGDSLSARMETQSEGGTELRMGLSYEGTYASSVSSMFTVSTGMVTKNLGLQGLELSLNLETFNALGIEATAYKNFGNRLFASLTGAARRDFSTYLLSDLDSSAVDLVSYEYSALLDATFGIYPFEWMELSVGFTREVLTNSLAAEDLQALSIPNLAYVHGSLAMDRLDHPIFPMSGSDIDIGYDQGFSLLGGTREYRILNAAGELQTSFGSPLAVGMLWRMGIDFSDLFDGDDSAPLRYKPDLADRKLFPNPLTAEQRLGNRVGALGLTLTYQVVSLSGAMRLPFFLLAHAAMGGAIRDTGDDLTLHWNGSLGLGLRVNDGFGFSVRGGMDNDYLPYLAIDLGSMGYQKTGN